MYGFEFVTEDMSLDNWELKDICFAVIENSKFSTDCVLLHQVLSIP